MISFWIFSPEALAISGQAVAAGIFRALGFMLVFALASAWGAHLIGRHYRKMCGDAGDRQAEINQSVWLTASLWAGTLGTTVFASTGMLVSAGYIFNEVFWHRFPNFAFAVLLLALVVFVQLLPEVCSRRFQAVTTMVCVVCLGVLVARGLLSTPENVEFQRLPAAAGASASALFPLLLVFAGFDRAVLESRGQRRGRLAPIVVTGAALLLVGWMLVSARFVESHRLAASTIPYLTAAREIWGQNGRLLMGAAVVAGCLAAVNGLFTLSGRMLAVPPGPGTGAPVPGWFPVILGVVLVMLLFGGLAGSKQLETLIRAALIVWVLQAGFRVVIVSLRLGMEQPLTMFSGVLAGVLIAACSAVMALSQDEWRTVVFAIILLLAGALPCVLLFRQTQTNRALNRRTQRG